LAKLEVKAAVVNASQEMTVTGQQIPMADRNLGSTTSVHGCPTAVGGFLHPAVARPSADQQLAVSEAME
jgi:hypothetical protein